MKRLKSAIMLSAILLTACSTPATRDNQTTYNGNGDYLYDMDDGYWLGKKYSSAELENYYSSGNHDLSTLGSEWDSIPSFSTMDSFLEYMRDRYDKRITEIYVKFENGFLPDPEKLVNYMSAPWLGTEVVYNDGSNACVIYSTLLYPGTRVADAYLYNDTSSLTAEEKKLYDIAESIVEEAKKLRDDLEAELYIHDKICEYATYYSEPIRENLPRYCTALGVFLDGTANCQGYADAFYMLSTMYGFEAGKISGKTAEGPHVWNTIEYKNDWYCVDVCWDDDAYASGNDGNIQYCYFNAPTEIISYDHFWEPDATPHRIEPRLDDAYFYGADGANDELFGIYEKDIEDAVLYCAESMMSGDNEIYIMAESDKELDTIDEISAEIKNIVGNSGYNGSISYNLQIRNLGQYTYMYIETV